MFDCVNGSSGRLEQLSLGQRVRGKAPPHEMTQVQINLLNMGHRQVKQFQEFTLKNDFYKRVHVETLQAT